MLKILVENSDKIVWPTGSSLVPVDSLRSVSNRRVRAMHERGGMTGSCKWRKFVRVCAQIYSGTQFTIRGPIPSPSLDPGPAGDWGDELRGSCGPLRGKTEKNVYVDCGFAYRAYIYFASTNDTGDYP